MYEPVKAAVERSRLYANIRNFFTEKDYLEVETPSLTPDLIPEATIDNFETTFINEFEGNKNLYLIPSPEIFIKKLLSSGFPSVFEISKCFRNCEQLGCNHNPEFTMLEYYTLGFDELDSIGLTKELISKVALEGTPSCVTAPWLEMTVREAVMKYTGLDLDMLQDSKSLRKAAIDLGLDVPVESWDDTFNRIFCNFVETSIPTDRPVLLKDYPKQIKCLAKCNGNYRRRWELYISGIEVANCYLEEDNPDIVASYYEEEYQKLIGIRENKVIPDCDPNYSDIFKTFPKCSGVAIGLDRLLMTMMGEKEINNVLLFPFAKF